MALIKGFILIAGDGCQGDSCQGDGCHGAGDGSTSALRAECRGRGTENTAHDPQSHGQQRQQNQQQRQQQNHDSADHRNIDADENANNNGIQGKN